MKYDEFLNSIKRIVESKKESFEALKENEKYKQNLKEGKESGNYTKPERLDDINDEFLKIGELLYEADKELNTSEFKKLKEFVLGNISYSNSSANLNKVIKIASHEEIQNHKDKLPKGWGTLAIISQLKKNEFEEFITNPKISPNTPRSVISTIVKECQGVEIIEGITLVKDSKSDLSVSRNEILSLIKSLNLESKGWKLREKSKDKKDKSDNKIKNNHNQNQS